MVDLLSFMQGILLYGPPGTGKTLIARTIATVLGSKQVYTKEPVCVYRKHYVNFAIFLSHLQKSCKSRHTFCFNFANSLCILNDLRIIWCTVCTGTTDQWSRDHQQISWRVGAQSSVSYRMEREIEGEWVGWGGGDGERERETERK